MKGPPKTRNGATVTTRCPAAKITAATKHQHPNPSRRRRDERDIPGVWGVGYPPAGRRRFWIVVLCCPECRGYHSHRTGPRGGVRRAGCGRGEYRVRVRRPLSATRWAA